MCLIQTEDCYFANQWVLEPEDPGMSTRERCSSRTGSTVQFPCWGLTLVSDVDPADGCWLGPQRSSGPLTSPLMLFVTEGWAHLLFSHVYQSLAALLRTSDCTSPLPPSNSSALYWLGYLPLAGSCPLFVLWGAFPLQEMFCHVIKHG